MILRAGALGLIDFSRMRPFDPAWHRRSRLILRGLSFEDDNRLYETLHRHHLAKLGVYGISSESLTSVQKDCGEALDNVLAAQRPWQFERKSKEKREQAEATAMKAAWERRFGSTDDPEVQARLERARDALLRMSAETPRPMTPDAFSGIFNKDTAAVLSGLSQMRKLDPNRS